MLRQSLPYEPDASSQDFLSSMPNEILNEIILHLDIKDIIAVSRVSKLFNVRADDIISNSLYRKFWLFNQFQMQEINKYKDDIEKFINQALEHHYQEELNQRQQQPIDSLQLSWQAIKYTPLFLFVYATFTKNPTDSKQIVWSMFMALLGTWIMNYLLNERSEESDDSGISLTSYLNKHASREDANAFTALCAKYPHFFSLEKNLPTTRLHRLQLFLKHTRTTSKVCASQLKNLFDNLPSKTRSYISDTSELLDNSNIHTKTHIQKKIANRNHPLLAKYTTTMLSLWAKKHPGDNRYQIIKPESHLKNLAKTYEYQATKKMETKK